MKKHISVVGAIIMREGSVLCAQRSATMALPGLWEFPGGKVEEGEKPDAALQREIREELLCGIRVGEHVETTMHEDDFGIVTLSTYYAELDSGEPQLTEHAELRWVPIPQLDSLDWAPADVPAVLRVMHGDTDPSLASSPSTRAD